MTRRRRGPAVLGALALTGAVAATAPAAPSSTITVRDAKGDARTNLDLQRASLKLTKGRLEASLTFAAAVTARDLLGAADAQPGSACLRVWTAEDADPANQAPERLVCVTARDKDHLRASVLRTRANATPERFGGARVSRVSDRSL